MSPGPGQPDSSSATATTIRHAQGLQYAVIPGVLANAVGLERSFDPAAYRQFLDDLMAEAGHPTDPVERMMLEQLALAHFRLARLHASAANAQAVETIKVLNGAASRLLSEFRRLSLALKAYRTPAPKNAT
jgi:hypothetical protein